MALLGGATVLFGVATWPSQVVSHDLIWCRHMALPGLATWLYVVLSYVFNWCCHMSPPCAMSMHVDVCTVMCHYYNPYPCMAAMCYTHGTS